MSEALTAATMTYQVWKTLTEAEKRKIRDLTGLSSQLTGLEGWRVEVETDYGEVRRFIVGRSTGWKPCHLEINNQRSMGGVPAEKTYKAVTKLYYAR